MSLTTRTHGELASLAEIAKLFGVTTKTVRRRIADGTLPAYRVGRQIRIDVAVAEAVLMAPMNPAAAAVPSERTTRTTAR